MPRLLGTVVLAIGLAMSVSAATQEWPMCRGVVGGFHDSGVTDLKVETRCSEMLIENLRQNASKEVSDKLAAWQEVWNVLRFPPRIFRYELTITAFRSATEVLAQGADDETRFVRSPYIEINRGFVFHVPKCSSLRISFLSPWPPKTRMMKIFWAPTPRDDDPWEIESTWPIPLAVPDAWGNNPAAATWMFHMEKRQVEPNVCEPQ